MYRERSGRDAGGIRRDLQGRHWGMRVGRNATGPLRTPSNGRKKGSGSLVNIDAIAKVMMKIAWMPKQPGGSAVYVLGGLMTSGDQTGETAGMCSKQRENGLPQQWKSAGWADQESTG